MKIEGSASAKELIESRGRAPVLGWAGSRNRRDPIDLQATDIRKTFERVQRVIKRNNAKDGV